MPLLQPILKPTRWWQTRRLVTLLGSMEVAEREESAAQLLAQGEDGVRILLRALYGAVPSACGAAMALHRADHPQGITTLLHRCYEEEWLLCFLQNGYPEGLRALRWLETEALSTAMATALNAASREHNLQTCLRHLGVALSALRVLALHEEAIPCALWERALQFGHTHLAALQGPGRFLACNLTNTLRATGIRGLLTEYPAAAFAILNEALQSPDTSVVQTAIPGLAKLKDKRAVPPLQAIAFARGWPFGHPLAPQARQALALLEGPHADALELLRIGEPEETAEELLRPVKDDSTRDRPHTLVRPLKK